MDVKNQFQLLPGTKKRLGIKVPGENRFLYVGSAILGAALVTSFAMTRYVGTLTGELKAITDQIVSINQKRDLKAEEILKVTKNRIDTVSGLIKDHTYWTLGMYKISSLIQDKVQIESFSGEGDKISIKILANNYSTVARQIASFTYDDSITDVDIGKIDPASSGLLELSMTLTFDKDKLLKKQEKKEEE
jgi:Tfp pilus assembly protein PilN